MLGGKKNVPGIERLSIQCIMNLGEGQDAGISQISLERPGAPESPIELSLNFFTGVSGSPVFSFIIHHYCCRRR
jgi:hypothetical protein